MKTSKKLTIALGASVVAIAVLVGSAFALFSDSETANAGAKAGTVDIDLTTPVLQNNGNINPGDSDPSNPPGSNPGTDHSLTFSVTNTGNKSVYNRNVIVISAKDKTNAGWLDARVFRLFETTSAPTAPAPKVIGSEVVKKYYVLADYSETETLPAATTKVIAVKYVIDKDKSNKDLVLNGDPTNPLGAVETETGYTSNTNNYHYLFSMDRVADNTYQGCDIDIDIISQAMQYRNSVNADWQTIATKTISTSAKDYKVPGVPEENEDKTGTDIVFPQIP